MKTPVIQVKNFTKTFSNKNVVSKLDFEVYAGDIFAFIGANGSGKTTTIRSLLCIYEADEGELLINGIKYDQDQADILGYLPEERGLYLNTKVLETMVYFGQIKGLSKSEAKVFCLDYLEKVGLKDKANIEIKKLSSGQQQKIQLGITIINKPKILILDEPTKGLDPVNRQLMLEMLFDLNKTGSTIIFSTHQMEEAEKIASRILMIKNGKKALYGDLQEVKESFGKGVLRIQIKGKDFPENPKLYTMKKTNNNFELYPKKNVTTNQILHYLLDKKVEIEQFEKTTLSLDEIFIKVTNDDKY